MMYVQWRGKGIWILWILFLTCTPWLSLEFLPKSFSFSAKDFFDKNVYWPWACSFLLSAIIIYFWGYKLNHQALRNMTDPLTGVTKKDRPSHTLYGIKMHYWSILYIGIAIYLFAKEFHFL